MRVKGEGNPRCNAQWHRLHMLSRVSLVHIWEKTDSARLSPLPEITQLEAETDTGRIQTCLVGGSEMEGQAAETLPDATT